MATLRVHDSTEYWKKTDLMVKPASYPMAAGYDVPSVDTIHRPLTLDLSEVCHEDRVYWAVRRAQDILLSSLALVALSPLLLITYAAIWIDSPGASPIFTQQRVGRNGKLFKMYKFRTMCPDAEQKLKDLMEHNEKDGPVFKMKNDPRITRVGKFLRKTSIDELPQLINILKGDMSIVGPRPERKCLADEISKEIPEFCYRLKVRGGLTGYAQIYGKYNTSAYDKLRLDMMYIENYSPLLDIRLIILTLRIIFSKDSTEGIDVAMENQRRADELWRELDEENEEKEKGGAE